MLRFGLSILRASSVGVILRAKCPKANPDALGNRQRQLRRADGVARDSSRRKLGTT